MGEAASQLPPQPGVDAFGPTPNLIEPDVRRDQQLGNHLDSAGILPEEQLNTATTVESLYPQEKERLLARAALRVGVIAESVASVAEAASYSLSEAPSVSDRIGATLQKGQEATEGLIGRGRTKAQNLGARVTESWLDASSVLDKKATSTAARGKEGIEDVKATYAFLAAEARTRKEARVKTWEDNKATRQQERQKRKEFLERHETQKVQDKLDKQDQRQREKLGKEAQKVDDKAYKEQIKANRRNEKQQNREQKSGMKEAEREKLQRIRDIKQQAKQERRQAARQARAEKWQGRKQDATEFVTGKAEAARATTAELGRMGKVVLKETGLVALGLADEAVERGTDAVERGVSAARAKQEALQRDYHRTKEVLQSTYQDVKADVQTGASIIQETATQKAREARERGQQVYHERRASTYTRRHAQYQKRAANAHIQAINHNLANWGK
jgi:hypothetical protein